MKKILEFISQINDFKDAYKIKATVKTNMAGGDVAQLSPAAHFK